MSGSHLFVPRNETMHPRYIQNSIIMLCLPIPTIIYLWEIYIFPGSVCLFFAAAKYVERSWEYINRSQTHECRNWEWGRTIPFPGIHKLDFGTVCTGRLNPMHRKKEPERDCVSRLKAYNIKLILLHALMVYSVGASLPLYTKSLLKRRPITVCTYPDTLCWFQIHWKWS